MLRSSMRKYSGLTNPAEAPGLELGCSRPVSEDPSRSGRLQYGQLAYSTSCWWDVSRRTNCLERGSNTTTASLCRLIPSTIRTTPNVALLVDMCQTYKTTSRLVGYGMIDMLRRASSSAIITMLVYNMCRRSVKLSLKHDWAM